MCLRSRVLLVLLLIASVQSVAHAQTFGIHYGPRSFWVAPVGTSAVDLKYEHLDANIDINGSVIQGFGLKTNTGVASFTHYFDFFGRTASVVAALPYVHLEGNLELPEQPVSIFDEDGITDPYFQFYTTLVGGEARDLESFVRNEPGFVAGAFVGTRVPVGEYDASKPVNPGGNRWEWRVGFPIQYISGLPTKQTSFEFVPIVYLFGDNDEAFGGNTSGQDPLFQLEAHVTRDLNRMFWGSINILYAFGGESSINGVGQDDDFDYLGGGATLGARLSRSVGVNVSVGTSLETKTGAEDGSWLRASFTKTF